MTAISNRTPPVTLEYDCRGERVQRTFEDAYAARRWYAVKEELGRNPTIIGDNHSKSTRNGFAVYIRVSTASQNEAGQKTEIERWLSGNGIDPGTVHWFFDKQTGDNLNRQAFNDLQSAIFAGDIGTIVVWKLDRLSRKMHDGINTLADWCDRGLRVVSVTQQIDFNGTLGKMLAAVLLGVAEMEQETRRERQAAGIVEAKKRGKYKGRKQGTTKAKPTRALQLQNQGFTGDEIARALGVSRNTVFRYLKQAKS